MIQCLERVWFPAAEESCICCILMCAGFFFQVIWKSGDAIISSGHNSRYNHPDTETVKLLKEKGINIYCTEFTGLCHDDIDEFERKCCGDTEVIIGERAYKIKTEARNLGCLNHAAC